MPKTLRRILKAAARKEKKKSKQRQQKNLKHKSKLKSSNHRNKSKNKNFNQKHKNGKQRNKTRGYSFKAHLQKLQQKQNNRKLLESQQCKKKRQQSQQRKSEIYKNRKPKTLELLKAQKAGNPRQIKGFKSKLTILTISYYKQQESNEEDHPFRDSYFAAKINKISSLNRSIEMQILKERLGPLAASLPHVLLHKKKIFDTIINFINDEAHKHILRDAVGLLIELAKDIRQEFMCFVDDLLVFLVEMLLWKVTNIINVQTVFGAFSLLLRYLEKYMNTEDIKRYYKTYFVRFIGNKNYYIRDFMAEIFANIFKNKLMLNYDLKDEEKVLMLRDHILSVNIRDYLYETKQLKDNNKTRQYLQIGLSVFLFQIVRGILKGFHSKTVDILPLMLRVLKREASMDDEADEEEMHQMVIFKEFVDLCAVYCNTKHSLQFFTPFYATLNDHLLSIQSVEEDHDITMNDTDTVECVDKAIIDEFVTASNTNREIQRDTNEQTTDRFLCDLDYLNRLLLLFTIWCSHNGGEVVPITASSNLVGLIKRLSDHKWINIVMQQTKSKDMNTSQIYIQRVTQLIVSCCKIYVFKKNAKFRRCAQNAIKILLDHCASDTKLIQFVIERLGETSIILDGFMRRYLMQWIETWSKQHETQSDNKDMTLFLEFIRKTQNKKSFDVGEDSTIINKVKDIMMTSPVLSNEEVQIDGMLSTYNTHNVHKISYAQSKQIQEYLPMIRHFPNKLQWIECITNLIQSLMEFMTSRKLEDYRFALFNKLHNVLIEILIAYLNENDLKNMTLPPIIQDLDKYWLKYFELITAHPYNSYLLDASLNFMEFIQSFHVFFKSKKKLNKNFVGFKQTVNHIMSRDTFNTYYPLLLRHLSSATMYGRRAAIAILCLFDPETQFIERDHFGTELRRNPILQQLHDVFHDDWGPSLERDRENKVVNIISFAKGLDTSLYHEEAHHKDIMHAFKLKKDGIKLGERNRINSDKTKSTAHITDYQLQIIIYAVFGLIRINYRPLWSHCIELLFILSQRFPDKLWNVLYHEILVDVMQMTHIRRDIAERLSSKQRVLINETKSAASRPLQVLNILFEAINKNHEFAASYIKPIIALFLKFMNDEYHLAFPHEAIAGNYGLMDTTDDATKRKIIKQYDWRGKSHCYTDSSKIRVVSKLRNFLSLFSALSMNYKEELDENTVCDLRDTFYRLLLLRELDLQKMTLTAYVRFYPQIAVYYSNDLRKQTRIDTDKKDTKRIRHKNASLKSLLKINTLKAGLVNFNLMKGDIGCIVNDEHRQYIVPVVIRILYNKLFEHQKRKIKSSVTSRRKAILTYISTLEKSEIAAFLDILHHSFSRWMTHERNDHECSKFAPGFAAQHQYISIIRLWQKCCPMCMAPFLDEFSKYLSIIFKHSYRFFMFARYRNGRTFNKNEEIMCRRNYKMCVEILRLFVQFYAESVSIRCMLKDWMECIKAHLWKQLPETHRKNQFDAVESMWSLWKTISRNVECCNFFDLEWPLQLVLQCLKSKFLSKYTHKSCIKIMKNLIGNKDTMRPLFMKYGKDMLDAMLYIITADNDSFVLPASELEILVFLSDIIEDKTQLQQLTDSLIPYLVKCKRKSRIVVSILQVLSKLMPNICNYQSWADPLCDILNSVNNKLGRSLLCQLLVNISFKSEKEDAPSVSWLKLVAPILLDLNCVYIEERTGNAVSYGLRRLRAYDYLSTDLLPQLNLHQLKLITSTILYDIGHTQADSSLEMASIAALRAIIEYDYINHKHLNPSHLATLIDHFINDFILKRVNNSNSQHKSKFLPLLAVICESRPNLNGNLHILGHDFFTLMASIKEEDQITALETLITYLNPNIKDTPTLNDRSIVILLPIIRSYVYMEGDIRDDCRVAALNAVGSMAQCACWIVYRWMIDKFMSDYKRDDKQKHINYKIIALECIMRISKRFHFDVDCDTNLLRLDEALSQRMHKHNIWESIDKEAKDKQAKEEKDNESKEEIKAKSKGDDAAAAAADDDDDNTDTDEDDEDDEADLLEEEIFTSSEDALDIQLFMYDYILVPLMEELRGKTKVIQSEHVHILSRVSVTVVFIAKYLPKSDFDGVFLAAVSTLCQFLESKLPKRRDKARKMLSEILKCVGPRFFRYIVKEIESRTVWGRYKHILGYSVCEMLTEMHRARVIEIGSLDHAVCDVTKILLHDIAGAIGAEKMLQTRRYRGKEAEDSRAIEGFEIMAKYITFNPHIHLILHPIAEFASRATDRTDWRLNKIKDVLQAMKKGLIWNKSVEMKDLIAFNYRMIREQLDILNVNDHDIDIQNVNQLVQPSDRRRGKLENTPFLLAAPNRACLISSTSAPKPCSMLMIKFCLELILLLFNGSFGWKERLNEYNMKQLELIPNLCCSIFNECRSEDIHVFVLKIAIQLLPFKLATFAAFGDVVIEYALEAITRTNVEMRDISLLLLSEMIKHFQLKLDDNMLDVILNYISEHTRTQSMNITGAIALLHAVLDRKMKSATIYDLMYDIHANLNKLKSEALTQQYSSCLTKFLLKYPLSDAVVKRHFEQIIGGLEHPFVCGRLCALDLISKIIRRFPVKVVDVYGLVIFVALIQKLANDGNIEIKRKIQRTLIILLNKIENDQFWEFWTMFEEWIGSNKFKLSMAALQAGISFMNQGRHEITASNYKSLCQLLINKTLVPAINQHESAIRVKDYGENAVWKPCYLSLELMESMYNVIWSKQPHILHTNDVYKTAFNHSLSLMDFPHRWVRTVCCKMLGFYLSIIGKEGLIKGDKSKDKDTLWISSDSDSIYNLCQKLCIILRDVYISESLCHQTIKNLLFLTLILNEKYLNELKDCNDLKWMRELKEKQQKIYREKMEQRKMSRDELKRMRKKQKKERKKEIEKLRTEKADWFDETHMFDDEDDTDDDADDMDNPKNITDIVDIDIEIKEAETMHYNKEANWRINQVFEFMTERIQSDDTSLDIEYIILQWFAAIVIKFTPYDLRLYDYYIITAIVYMLKQRRNPHFAIKLKQQYNEIEGKPFEALNLRQKHRIEMYTKCCDLSQTILTQLKEKIGDSAFLNKFYQIKQQKEMERNERKYARSLKRKREKADNNNDEQIIKKQKIDLNHNNKEEQWISFLWS